MAVKQTKCNKLYELLPLQDPPIFTQIGTFGLKIYPPSGNPASDK
jgi:hypothetical protein